MRNPLLLLAGLLVVLLCAPRPSAGQFTRSAETITSGDGKGEFDLRPAADGFGASVAISGRLAFVAEPRSSLETGNVTVYHRDTLSGVWTKEATLTGGTPGERFGETLDADGLRVLVGAPSGAGGAGVAYVFVRQSPGVWIQEDVLQSSAPVVGRWYALTSLSISGDYAVVGEGRFLGSHGAAHVYKRSGSSWDPDTTLAYIEPGDRFGTGVAVSGGRLAVGAYYWNPDANNQRVGKVYLYELGGSVWSLSDELTLPDSMAFDYFGYTVDVDGDRVAAGNAGNSSRPRGYRIFDYEGGSGNWVLRDSVENQGYVFDLDSATVVSGIGGLNLATVNSAQQSGTAWEQEGTLWSAGLAIGDNFGYDVAVSADFAVVGAPGNFIGSNDAYLFERQPDSTWAEVASFKGSGTPLSITGITIPCSGGMADDFPCSRVDLQSYLNKADLLATGNMSDIWGWTDPVTDLEYALVTHGGGVTFVDVTDPVNPIVVGVLPLHPGTYNSAWRDVKTYADHAFIVADAAGPQGIQVFDLSELRAAQELPSALAKNTRTTATTAAGATAATGATANGLPVTFSETAHYDLFTSAHNIGINEDTGTAFVVGGPGNTCVVGIHIVDITTPTAPDSTGCYVDNTTGRGGSGYTHDIQCVTYDGPDTDYTGREICFGSNETAVLIADVTDRSNPVSLGKGEYPDYGYVHQGWLTEDHRFFVQDDELDERQGDTPSARTLFWDVTDLTDPVLIYAYNSPVPAVDHNQYVKGSLLYQAQYASGLRILDIGGVIGAVGKTGVVTPTEVGYFDTFPPTDEAVFSGAWSVYPYFESGNLVVSSIGEGLFVVRPQIEDVTLDLRILLEGPYVDGADSMSTSPGYQAAVPTANPFEDDTYDGTSLELDVADSVVTLPIRTVDWVSVELRTDSDPDSAVAKRAAILLTTGEIVDPNGNPLRFPGVDPDSYFVVVRQRNHLAVMSSSEVDATSGSGSWNFTTRAGQAFGTNPMKDLGDGRWGLFAGESDLNGLNSTGDFNAWLSDTKSAASGYVLADFDLDGQVIAGDFNIWLANTKAAAASGVPE